MTFRIFAVLTESICVRVRDCIPDLFYQHTHILRLLFLQMSVHLWDNAFSLPPFCGYFFFKYTIVQPFIQYWIQSYVSVLDTGEITFSNTAKGLSAVDAEQLFDRFYTVEAAHHSTGLGLSIALTLVRRMGGTITAEYADSRLKIKIKF